MASNSITNYLQRLGKSISYAAFEVLKEQVPVTTNFIQSNSQTVRDTIKAVVDSKNTVNRVADALNVNTIINSAKTAYTNAKTDIKSGNFYNPDRTSGNDDIASLMAMMGKMMGEDVSSMMDGIFNEGSGEDGEGSADESPIKGIPEITKGDTVVASVIGSEVRRASNSISDTLAAIANANGKAQQSIASVQISQNERQTLILNAGLSSIAQGMNSIIEFNNKVLKIQAENTKLFQEKMINLTTENNAIFKELIEIQRTLYKPKQKEEENPEQPPDIFAHGFNLKSYMDYLKRNVEKNPMYQMAYMFIQSMPMMLQEVVNNPLQFAAKKLIEGFMGPALKTALSSFDNTISNAFRTVLARFYDYGHDVGTRDSLLGKLARIFGYKEKSTSFRRLDTSKYNKGAMSWNGVAQKSLVEVIPAYLRRIEAAATGKGERYFDYQSGRWTSAKSILNMEKGIDNKFMLQATSEIRTQMQTMLAPFMDEISDKDRKEVNTQLLKFLKGIYDRGSVDYKDIMKNPQNYGDNERLMQLFFRMLAKTDRDAVFRATGRIANAKKNKTRMVEGTDASNQGAYNDIASGALKDMVDAFNAKSVHDTKYNITSSPALNLTNMKDSRGLTLYDYQLMIYRELFAIRHGGGIGGGGNGEGTVDPLKGFAIKDNQLPDVIKNESSTEQNKNKDVDINDPKFKSNRKSTKQEFFDLNRQRIRNLNRIKVMSNGLEMEDSLDLQRYLTDDEYANYVLSKMNEIGSQTMKSRRQSELDSNKGMIGNVMDLFSGGSNQGYPDGVDPDAPFIEQMAQAATIGQKMGVISRNLQNIASAPTSILTGVITTADKFIYDMLFDKEANTVDENGESKKTKGIFGKFISEIEDMFGGVNDWLNDIFKNLSESSGGFAKKIKDILKNVFNFDVDEKVGNLVSKAKGLVAPVGEVLKSGVKNNFKEITNAFRETAADLGYKKKQKPKSEQEQDEEYWGEMGAFASGAQNVKKGGLAFISEGEAIIPADLNPWNPNRDKVNRKEQSKNESRMKQRFMSKLGSTLSPYISQVPQHANGSFDFKANASSLIHKIPKPMLAKLLGEISDNPEEIAAKLEKNFGIKLDPEEINRYKNERLELETQIVDPAVAKQILQSTLVEKNEVNEVRGTKQEQQVADEEQKLANYNRGKGAYNGINQFLLSAFGKDTTMAAGDITEYVIKHSPEMATGGVGGALLATVLPLGGPLFGAIAGSVVGLLTRNKSFMEYMFGSEMTDPKTGKVITKEGVIPRKIVNTIQKYMPDMKKYGIVGTLTGLITPFGPLGGLMIGAGASIVKNNEDLKRILFGEETGLLNKNRKQFLKKALPNIGAGVLATLFFGPMGILGNAAVGAGLGLLTTTEQFKRVILGTKDRNGIRRGGLAGAIRDQITEPFKNTMRDIGQNLGNWFRDKVLGPIGRGLIPTGKIATSILSWGINTVVRKFSNSIGGRFLDGLFNFALGRIRNVGGLGKFITKKIGGIIAGGSSLVERAGSKIQALGLKGGFGENLTVGERLEIQSRNNMMHTDRAKFDMALAKLNPRELQANAEALEMLNELQNGSVEALTERKVRSEAYSLTSDLQGKMGGGKEQQISKSDVRGIENKLRKIQTDKDLEDLVTSIDKDRKYSYISDKNKEEIKEFILKNGRKILEMRRRYASLSDSNTVNKLRNTVKERMNLAGVDDETFNKHLADYTKYANAELERQDKTLSKKLMADKESGKLQPDATVDNLIKMTDFQKAQLEEQKEMNKNLRTLIEVALGNKSSVLGQTKDVDMLRDQNKMDKISRDLDSEEDRINRILGQNKAETAKQVKGLKKDIFGESANNGALQHMSDENLLSLLGPDKKKRNEAITYMRAISSNYDKTLSKLMNTDKFLELSSTGMRRITELTLRGYEVKPEDYKDIESLSKYGYKAIIELAKMGVKIDSYKAIDRYFDKYGTGSEKKKSLNALLDFAGVKLKDGRKIAEVLTTSEIADNLEDDDVRLLRANNEYNSYQIGINKSIKEGNVPEKLKLASTANSEDLTTKKKGDVLFDADKAVSNTNLDATIQKTADLVDNTVKKIYDTNKSVLKTVLEVVGQFAEAGARKAVPGADTILDTREAIKNARYNEGRLKNDKQFAEDQRKSDLKYESTETYLKHQQGTSQKYNVVEEGFEKRRDPGRNNSITEAKAAQQRKEERRKQEREEQKKQEEQKKADSTTATTTVSGGKLADEGKVPKVETTVNSTMNHMAEMLTQMMSGYSPVDMDDNIGTHAGGLLSAFTNSAINSLAEKISPGSTAKFSDAKSSSDNKGEQQQTTSNKPQPINALEEANNERQMNSITDASKVGFTLNANPVAGETGGTVPNKPTDGGNVNLSTGDGDPVQYTKNRNGELVEVHNKNNVEVRAKQKYKLELQERSTRALELIAKGAGYAGNKVVSGAKKATGGIFDLMKGLFTMPLQLIGSIVSMIPFAGPLLGLAGKGLGFIGKFLGGKLLEKFAGTGLGKTAAGWIGKLGNTRIGNAIAERFGLNKFKDMVFGKEENEENTVEEKQLDTLGKIHSAIEVLGDKIVALYNGKDPSTVTDTSQSTSDDSSSNNDSGDNSSSSNDRDNDNSSGDDSGKEDSKKDDKKQQEEDNKKKDTKPEENSKSDKDNKGNKKDKDKKKDTKEKTSKKRGFFGRQKDKLSNRFGKVKTGVVNRKNKLKDKIGNVKTGITNKKNKLKDKIGNTKTKVGNTKTGTALSSLGNVLNRATGGHGRLAALGALGAAAIGGLEMTNYGTFTGEGLYQNARYATGMDTHAFDGSRFGLDNLTADEQMRADQLIKLGKSQESVANYIKMIHQDNGVGGTDQENLYEQAADAAATPFEWAWGKGKDALNALIDSPINNPLTETLVGYGVQRLTGGNVWKGATANTLLEAINNYRSGEYDDSSIWGMGADIAGDYLLNLATGGGLEILTNEEKKRREDKENQKIDDEAKSKEPGVDQGKTKLLSNPLDSKEYKALKTNKQRRKWRKKHRKEIQAYEAQQRSLKERSQNTDTPENENKSTKTNRFKNKLNSLKNSATKTGSKVGSKVATVGKRAGSKTLSGLKTAGKGIGHGLKNILKTKKGKVGAAALIATPLLAGLFDDNSAEASSFNPRTAQAFETKGSIKGNIDEQQFTEEAEASDVEETTTPTNTEEQETEESSGILDMIRENPILSSAIGFVGGVKGGEWGGKLGEKLLGSKGKLIGSLLGGTLGGNILDPTAITPEGIVETFITNKAYDKGTELLENVFNRNKDGESPTDELDILNDELKDKNQNNIDNKVNKPDAVNTKSKTLKDRFKDFTSGIKNKTGSITESLKDKVGTVKTSTSNITNNIQNIDMKRTTDSAIQTARKGIDEGQLKVQALVGQLKDRIMALTSKLGRWIKGDGVIKAIKNFTSKLIESITRPQNIKKIINKLAKSSLKSLALGGGPLVFAAITGVGAISDFISGYNNSDELYHLSPGLSTPGMKIVAGFVSALVGVIPYISILIPEDFVLELAVEYIGPAFGFGKKELEELRKSGKEQQDKEGNEVVQNSTFGDDFQSLVKNATGGIISKVVGAADDAASAVADVGKTIANKVGESASVAKNWVADTAKTVGDWISDKASRGWEYLKDKANSAAETVGEIYNNASSTVKEKYESVKQTIKEHLPSFGSGKHSLYGMNKFYSQLDPKYAMDFNAQGDSIHQTMKDSGCGPAALSNAMSSVGIQVDPRLAAQYALQNGYKETDGGTRPEFFTDMMNKLGTGSNRLHNQDEITNSLKQGQPVILMGKDSRGETKQNPYAENPHYVTATGIDRKGNIIVQDPESYTPNKRYKASDILNKSTIAIGTGRSKKRLYGRSRSTINRVANKIISRIPRMYGRSRYGRGSDMGAEIFDYLHKGIGLSTIATAGIMGNMKAESGLMPDRVQGDGIITAPEITVDGKTGYGLCQWTFESRQQGLVDFAQARGTPTSDMKTQCDYMMQEIEQNHAGLIQRMDETGSAGAAAIQFHDEFEGSADDPDMKQRRATYAEEIFQNEGRGMAEAGTYQGGSSAGSSGGKKNGGLFGAIANISSILSSALNPFGTASASPTTPKINNTSTVDGKTFSNTQMMANYGTTQGKEVYGTKDADGNVTIHTQSADNAFGINSNVSNDSIANDVLTGGKELTFKTGSGKHKKLKSRYGRFKHFLFGTGDEEPATSDSGVTTTTTEPSTNTPNMDAQEVKAAQDASANTQNETKPKTTSSSSLFSGGLFSGIESFAKQVASPLSKVMSKFGGVLKTGITSVFGDKLKLIFGDNNPFLDIFTGGDSGSSSNGNKPGSTAGPDQTVNIKVAGNPVDTLLGSMPGAVVTSDYGVTDGRPTAGAHGGVDIGGLDIGTPIPSPIAGTVYQLGQGHGGGYGHYVQLVDKSGNYHMFAHCDEQMVQEGQQVQPGTILGTIGKTGVADGEHLHYEIDPPSNVGAIKEGEHINPNSYTGAGKHFNSTLKDRMPNRFGRGIDTSLLGKQSNDTFEGLDNTNIENTPDQNMDITQNYEYNKPRDDTFVYDGFGDNDPKYKYGTGWFSDFTKRSINTIRDTFDRWFSNDKKEEDKETTNVSTDTQQKESSNVPSKQPDSIPKTSSDVPVTPTTTKTKDSNVHPVSDSQKLDAILDAMNENNRLVQQQNQLLSSLINIASNYINSNVVTIDENQKVRMNKQESQLNTNTRRNNPSLTGAMLRSQLSQFGGGSQYGLGDRFGTRDGDGFNEIIRNMNTVATR